MFSVHSKPEKLKNATIAAHFGFVFEENLVMEITWLSWPHRFQKAPFSKCFRPHEIQRADIFKFLWFEERFRKALFSWRISVHGRPNRRNKAAFSNFSGVVWTLPNIRALKGTTNVISLKLIKMSQHVSFLYARSLSKRVKLNCFQANFVKRKRDTFFGLLFFFFFWWRINVKDKTKSLLRS